MKKFLIFISVLIILAVISLYFFRFSDVSAPTIKDMTAYMQATSTRNLIQRVEKKIAALPPILSIKNYPNSNLSRAGILDETNKQRKENGDLSPLSQNSKLNQIANLRIKDMFEKEYFEHKSPTGIGASDIASDVGYEFILIGENIALGNFKDDKALVQAWMDSPGHRANILNVRYTEIGIGAEKGLYKGKEVWLSVQIFGRPLNLCNEPDITLKQSIDEGENLINVLDIKAKAYFFEINSMKNEGVKNAAEYNKKVREYNDVVNQIKSNEVQLKILIEKYNNQIKIFNSCVKG